MSNTSAAASTASYSWIKVWLVSFFKPPVATFEKLVNDPRAGFGRAFAWAFLGSLGTTIAALALLLITGSIAGFELLKDPSSLPTTRIILIAAAALLPVAAAGGILGLLANTAVAHFMAKITGGKRSFRKLTYGMSTYLVPAAFISTILSFIPAVGAAALLVEAYTVYLDTAAVKAIHRITWGGAFLAALVPFLLSLAIKAVVILSAIIFLFGAEKFLPGLIGK